MVIAVAAALATPLTAYAEAVPRYDPVAWCEEVASTGGGMSETIKRGCLEEEQSAYDRLKEKWAAVPMKSREWCDQVARTASHGSYSILAGCISEEMDNKEKNDGAEFKF